MTEVREGMFRGGAVFINFVVLEGTVVAVDASVKVLEGLATAVWVGVLTSIGIKSLNVTGPESQLTFAVRSLVTDPSRL